MDEKLGYTPQRISSGGSADGSAEKPLICKWNAKQYVDLCSD
jgi:hypothetical protein